MTEQQHAEIREEEDAGPKRGWRGSIRGIAVAIVGAAVALVGSQGAQAAIQFSEKLELTIEKASAKHGVPVDVMRAFAGIESGGNPKVRTGSYYGVYQLSHKEFRKYGGRGNIMNMAENTEAAARKLRAESDEFERKYDRPPTATELYMLHQQGVGGAAKHIANPDDVAWRNMHRTGEGKKRGARWARKAVWGNVPTDQRKLYPKGVEGMTSRQFMDMWERRLVRFGALITGGGLIETRFETGKGKPRRGIDLVLGQPMG